MGNLTRRGFVAGTAALALTTSARCAHSQTPTETPIPFTLGTNRPSTAVPGDACDSHFHIYNSSFPPAANASLIPPDASVADYRVLQARLGTVRGVVVQPSTYGTDNSCLLDALKQLGDGFRGVAVVDDRVEQAELERLNAAGVRGIRFNLGRAGATTIDMVRPLAKRVAELGWHVQVHMKGVDIAANAAVFEDLPVPVVFDHLGRIPMPDGVGHPAFKVVANLLESGRGYVKISSLYQDTVLGPLTYADVGVVAKAYVNVAPDRVLWGSDWPHPSKGNFGVPDDALLLDLAADWAGRANAQRIFVDNPANLYGFNKQHAADRR